MIDPNWKMFDWLYDRYRHLHAQTPWTSDSIAQMGLIQEALREVLNLEFYTPRSFPQLRPIG